MFAALVALATAALTLGSGAAVGPASLSDVALSETQAAVAEARAAGHPVECPPVVAPLADDPEKRSWTWFEACRIVYDRSTVARGDWWWHYVARHEVCHLAHRWKTHHDLGFRACESRLAANVGIALVYGDDPDGYPVEYVRLVQINGMTTDTASLVPDHEDDARLCAWLQEAKPWIPC